ncbi:MAG: hypothetical protein AAF597_05385, partial [Bacteroidota bacterium]
GLKVDDIGSLVGQNWRLNAGGSISRVVKGLPDDFNGTLEGTGIGRDYKLVPRIQLPSNLGVRLKFPGSDNIPGTPLNTIRRGLNVGPDEAGISLGDGLGISDPNGGGVLPVKLDIRWTPLNEIGMVNFSLQVPVLTFEIFNKGFAVYIELGMKIGVAPEQVVSNVHFNEDGLGYLFLDSGLSGFENGVANLTDIAQLNPGNADYEKYLALIHPNIRFDDAKFLSNTLANFSQWIEVFDGEVPEYNTKRIDVQPDEFYFTAGSYSGKFYLDMKGKPRISPYVPGVQISDPVFDENDQIAGFTIVTEDGLLYVYGAGAVDYTENINYSLSNYYTYNETGFSPFRTRFDSAKLDIGVIDDLKFFGRPGYKTFSNTYLGNYKIMEGPRYASTWHLKEIRSRLTQEVVGFNYDSRSLRYYSDKNYSHTFPNFDIEDKKFKTNFNQDLNPVHTRATKWENGRADFTYHATEARLDRWHLTSIETGRSESAYFHYETPRKELPGDMLCSRVMVNRGGSLFQGWKFSYAATEDVTLVGNCNDTTAVATTSPVSIASDTRFLLGDVYDRPLYDNHAYFFWNFSIGSFSIPLRSVFGYGPNVEFIAHREEMSEFGSLMEVKGFDHRFYGTPNWFNLEEESAIFSAEFNRSFLQSIEGIDQSGDNYDFVTSIAYNNAGSLPKRFSVDQDMFGYHANNPSGSPLPQVTYAPISSDTDISTGTNGFAKHFAFSNAVAPGSMHLGQPGSGALGEVSAGSLKKLTMATGASIAYQYELNQLPDDALGFEFGAGLRVASITRDPGDTPAQTTTYSYEDPAYNNLPVRVFQKEGDEYYRGLEQRVYTTSNFQNELFPNGNGFVGYRIVKETTAGLGTRECKFTTPATFAEDLSINITPGPASYNCAYETKNNILTSDWVLPPTGTGCSEDFYPELFTGDLRKRCGSFFGVKIEEKVRDAGGGLAESHQYSFENLPLPRVASA